MHNISISFSGSSWFFYHAIAPMFLATYNISFQPRSYPVAKRMALSFDSLTQQLLIIFNKSSWRLWGVLEELILLFNKHLLSAYYMPDIGWGAKHGGGEQDSKDFFSHRAPICINKNTYK